MPDLAVHLLTSYIANYKLRLNLFFFLVGAMFPDILGRTLVVLFPQSYLIGTVSSLLHSTLLVFLVAYMVVFFFRETRRREYFVALLIGTIGHLSLDATQKHFRAAYRWFFPFSFKTFEIPLLWPDQYVLLIPLLILLAVAVWFLGRRRQGAG